MTTLAAEPEDRPAPEGEPPIEEQVEHLKAALRRMTSTALIPAGRVIYSGSTPPAPTPASEDGLPIIDSSPEREGLRARRAGKRVLTFANGRHEEYEAVEVWHEPSAAMWDRILVARDDGTLAQRIVDGLAALAASEMPKGVIGCDGQHESGSTFGCEDPAHCEVAEGAGLDGAWAAAETAPPEGWTLHTLRQFRSPLMRDPVWQAIAGPNGRYAASGEGETPAAALRALAARLATTAPEEAPE